MVGRKNKETGRPQKKKPVKGQKKSKTEKTPYKDLWSESEEDYYCIISVEVYSNSRSCKKSIKCMLCEHWGHEQYTNVKSRNFYVRLPEL